MKPTDILEWTMGWPWPILIGLGILMVWGITQVITWDEQYPNTRQSSSRPSDEHCICECDLP